MTKWVILGILIYLVCGCVTAFVLQLLKNSDNDEINFWGCSSEEIPFLMIMWPLAIIIITISVGIPWILKKFYTLFVTIIFLILALFKKEKSDGS